MQKEEIEHDAEICGNVFSDIIPDDEKAEASDDEVLVKAILSIAASLNHEINNPLTSILGNTQLLLESPLADNPGLRRKLKTIELDAVKIRKLLMKLNSMVSPSYFSYGGKEKLVDLRSSQYECWIGEED